MYLDVVSEVRCKVGYIFWASLSKPHIDYDNRLRVGNNRICVKVYVSFTLYLSSPGSPDPCTPWRLSMETGR